MDPNQETVIAVCKTIVSCLKSGDLPLPSREQMIGLMEQMIGMAAEITRLRAELEDEKGRVEHWKSVHVDWLEKTQWVQDILEPKELGKHRADVIRERLAAANAEIERLKSRAWGY